MEFKIKAGIVHVLAVQSAVSRKSGSMQNTLPLLMNVTHPGRWGVDSVMIHSCMMFIDFEICKPGRLTL